MDNKEIFEFDILMHISSSEMDFITLLEADISPPIAFRDRAALDRWVGGRAAKPARRADW